MKYFVISCVLFTAVTSAQASVDGTLNPKETFCKNRNERNYFLSLFKDDDNHLSFPSSRGALGIGVCWWHSRLQRSAAYLSVFWPERKPPNENEATALINDIVNNRRVVDIPGYKNILEFSEAWEDKIREALDGWQILDGLAFIWISGVTGESETSAANLQNIVEDIYERVEVKGEVTYVKFNCSDTGGGSHSELIIGVEPQFGREELLGYQFSFVDSNNPGEISTSMYRLGDTKIDFKTCNSVPYVEQTIDLDAFKSAQNRYCQSTNRQSRTRPRN